MNTPASRIVKTYSYTDAAGKLMFQVVRYDPKDFRHRQPDGNGGWLWNMEGVPRFLYRLPELVAADPAAWVFICEGEKDVDALAALGLVATCNPGGAGNWKRLADDSVLHGRRVCILADKDAPGRAHGQDVAQWLHGKAADVRIMELPDVGGVKVKDASDWINAQDAQTPADLAAALLALSDTAASWTPPATAPMITAPKATDNVQLTDLGNAQRFAYRVAEQARFCAEWGKWLIRKPDRWKVDDRLDILTLAKRTALSIFDEAKAAADPDRQKALASWAVKSQSRYALAAMVDLARPDLAVNVSALDADPFAFNVLNGTIDLKTGELRPHDPDDLLTCLAPVRFDPAAKCPLWDAFLDRIMDHNTALIGYLQRRAGMCLTADISEQSLWMDHGGGANGKSVHLDTLTGLMGDYAGEAPPDLLLMRNNPEHPTEIADLCGRRLVVASETDEGRRLRVQLVKRLTGNSRLKARYMRGDYFEFPRTHKLILATNNRPIIKETTLAIWRRIKLVPFGVTVPPEEQDRHLTEKLAKERPGILNWAIKGCLAWQRDGMNEPAEVLTATAAYQSEQDPLADFFDTACIFASHVEAPRADLFACYAAWAERAKDHRPLDRTTFFERIRTRPGVDEGRRRIDGRLTRFFTGIGLVKVEYAQP